ncbi:MAG: hypothetical protein ACJAZ2_002008 [Glaciecola sp.]|jgi:hypothetical protein
MKFIVLFLLNCWSIGIFSQTVQFKQVLPAPYIDNNLIPIRFGDSQLADVDGDGDLDLLLTGKDITSRITALYLNDGSGKFTRKDDFKVKGLEYSSADFGDVDGDNDLDLVICGRDWGENNTLLFLNDGKGNFTENVSVPFDDVQNGTIKLVDVDKDRDLDVFLIGASVIGDNARMYLNDGSGNFSWHQTFSGVQNGDFSFTDIDGDEDLDLYFTGQNGSLVKSYFYIRDSLGKYNLWADSPFEATKAGEVVFADLDGDVDMDVVITGINNSGSSVTRVYFNDSAFHFTQDSSHALVHVGSSAIKLVDIDDDKDLDVILSGRGNGSIYTRTYKNDSTGTFVEFSNGEFYDAENGSFAIGDIDGDSDLDVIQTGREISVMLNDSTGYFSKIHSQPFPILSRGSVMLSDVDNDGDDDVFICGLDDYLKVHASLYRNKGDGNFSLDSSQFTPMYNSEVKFFDANHDSFKDCFVTGVYSARGSGSQHITDTRMSQLYMNDGNGHFSLSSSNIFEGSNATEAEVAIGDFNNDGHPDILYTSHTVNYVTNTLLYLNDGLGNFSQSSSTELPTWVGNGRYEVFDVDGDKDQDIVVSGTTGIYSDVITKVFINDGNASFSEGATFPFQVATGALAHADINGDTFPDIFITGENNKVKMAGVFINDGKGIFTLDSLWKVDSTRSGGAEFADFDGNGFPDLYLTGVTNAGLRIGKLYLNSGTGFSEDSTILPAVNNGDVSIGNINSDGSPDILVSGYGEYQNYICKLYSNTTCGAQNHKIQFGSSALSILNYAEEIIWVDCSDNFSAIPGETKSLFKPFENGSYAAIIHNNGCVDTTDCFNFIITGVKQLEDEYLVYPNPSKSKLNITGNNIKAVEIVNSFGSVVGRSTLPSFSHVNLASGIYFVRIITTYGKTITKSVVIQKK